MNLETEHKYLVNQQLWKQVIPEMSIAIKQAYLSTDPEKTIRVRTSDSLGFITIKGKSVNHSRPEYEYEIPFQEAKELIANFCTALVEKTRYIVKFGNHYWEVDVFEGLNAGLMVAEIELKSDSEPYERPEWLGDNVSDDFRYANSYLGLKPFSTW